MNLVSLVSLVYFGAASVTCYENSTLDEQIRRQEVIDGSDPANVLSRSRRYLVFPSGSSLQVVFCLTAGSYIGIADIFYLGATAALAWQLPNEPFIPFHRRTTTTEAPSSRVDKPARVDNDSNGGEYRIQPSVGKNILVNRYTGEPIQPFVKNQLNRRQDLPKYSKARKSYPRRRKKMRINAALAKRSANETRLLENDGDKKDETVKKMDKNDEIKKKKKKRATVKKIDTEAMHKANEDRKYLKEEHMEAHTVEYHRQTRSQLYEKIERMLRGMGNDGRHCVLKALCEIGQDKDRGVGQGSFLDEIMRAIFTLPKGQRFEAMHHQAYDEAHSAKKNCTETFHKCTSSLSDL